MALPGFRVRVDIVVDIATPEAMRGAFVGAADQLFARKDIEDADVATDFDDRTVTLSMTVADAIDVEEAFARGCAIARDAANCTDAVDKPHAGWVRMASVDAALPSEDFAFPAPC